MQRRVFSPVWVACLAVSSFVLVFVSPLLRAQTPPPPQPEPVERQQDPSAANLTEAQKAEMRGDIMIARKQYADAIVQYEAALAASPRNAVLLNKIGIACHQMMRLDDAKKHYERSIKADRTYAHAYNNLATVFYSRKKYRQAIRNYRKALELKPETAAFHSNLGYAFFAQKKYDEALVSFQRAVQLDPEIFERRSAFGSVLLDRSVADLPFFYFFLAKSYAMQGNAERCAHYLRKARDEGYKGMAAVPTDPAFAPVIKDPVIQEILNATPPATASTKL